MDLGAEQSLSPPECMLTGLLELPFSLGPFWVYSVEKLGASETARKKHRYLRARVLLDGTGCGIFHLEALS